MRKIVVLGLVLLFAGCSNFKVAVHGGRVNVVRVSQENRLEKRSWDYVVAKFEAKPATLQQPQTLSGTRDFVQDAYEAHPGHSDNQVGGFYNRRSNLVVYITGEYSILVHEYCHAVIHQLKVNVSRSQNEYFCTLMKKEYEGRLDIRTKGQR